MNKGRTPLNFSSPNTCIKLLYLPKLNPSLSGPVWNIGARKASNKRERF